MPAYGPEQRGGTANVTVIVKRRQGFFTHILSKYDTAIILNQPSLEKFENRVEPGGILIYDGYGIINPPTRKRISRYIVSMPWTPANEMNNAKAFNMIVLGGLLKLPPDCDIGKCNQGIEENSSGTPSPT